MSDREYMERSSGRPRLLYIPVEFAQWKLARGMPYDIQLGLEEGFEASGFDVITLPALWDAPSSSPRSWLSHAKKLLAGQKFDQVWIILLHCHYEDDFLQWLKTLAPIRVGFVHESFEYTPEEQDLWPPLKYRRTGVEHQIRAMTHVMTCDEYDAQRLNAQGICPAVWWPGCVPARLITPPTKGRENLPATFCGSVYGERAEWLKRDDLRHIFTRSQGPENATKLPQDFDSLQAKNEKLLLSAQNIDLEDLNRYAAELRDLRRTSFDMWMASLTNACAQINLPSLVKVYGSRVVESMAAGCPVISWEVPNRPRNGNLFEPDSEILLFRRNRPDELAAQILRVHNNPEFTNLLADRAQAKVRQYHTIEKRVEQVLAWIATGAEPDYGEKSGVSAGMFSEEFASTPNREEKVRWSTMAKLMEKAGVGLPKGQWRILDVGCGRGWVTQLANEYGCCHGLDCAPEEITRARGIFPHLKFFYRTLEQHLSASDFEPYDFVLLSEILEFLPVENRTGFIAQLGRLLRPGGCVIMTAPRGEAQSDWERVWQVPYRVAETWIAEAAVGQMFAEGKFALAARERIYFHREKREYVSDKVADSDPALFAAHQACVFQFTGIAVPWTGPEATLSQFHQACLSAADAALQVLPDHSILLTEKAATFLDMGQIDQARGILRRLLVLHPGCVQAHRLYARVLCTGGESKQAEQHISRANELEALAPGIVPLVSVFIPPETVTQQLSLFQHLSRATLPDGSLASLQARLASVDRRDAPCVHLHPSTRLRVYVPNAGPGRLTCKVSVQPDAWNRPNVDGCEFAIHSNGTEIFRRMIHPRRQPAEKRWHDIEVEIPSGTGLHQELLLSTKLTGFNPCVHTAVWCEPILHLARD